MAEEGIPRLVSWTQACPGNGVVSAFQEYITIGASNTVPRFDFELPQFDFEKHLRAVVPSVILLGSHIVSYETKGYSRAAHLRISGSAVRRNVKRGRDLAHGDIVQISFSNKSSGRAFEKAMLTKIGKASVQRKDLLATLPDLVDVGSH